MDEFKAKLILIDAKAESEAAAVNTKAEEYFYRKQETKKNIYQR